MRVLAIVVVLAACGSGKRGAAGATPGGPGGAAVPSTIQLASPAFGANEEIPTEYTCEAGGTSPPLAWGEPPAQAKALALLVDDPDAPNGTFVHWVAVLPASSRTLPAGASKALPTGSTVGRNGWGKAEWGGPCPPSGRHHYVFTLYAIDVDVDATGLDEAALVAKLDGHAIARGELVGTYQKKK